MALDRRSTELTTGDAEQGWPTSLRNPVTGARFRLVTDLRG